MSPRSFSCRTLTVLLLLTAVGISGLFGDSDFPRAEGGILDLRNLNLGESGPLTLDGEWAFYWDVVVDPGTGYLPHDLEPDHFTEVPSYWDELIKEDFRITQHGVATYELKILLPEHRLKPLALKFLNVTPNAVIYVNGERMAEIGTVHPDKNLSRPGNRALIIPFTSDDPEMTVTISISNFHNVNGGLNRPVGLGGFEEMRLFRERRLSLEALFLGGLLLMGLYQVLLFLLHPRRKAPLFMAILCILAFLFSGLKHEMVLLALFPGWDGEVRTKIIYLALTLAPAVFTYYAYNLYPAHFSRLWNRIIAITAILFALFIFVTPKAVYTRAILPLELILGLAAAYNLFMLVRGYIRSRDRQILLYMGGLLFLLASIFIGMIDNAVPHIFRSIAAMFFIFILYQAFLQAYIYSYTFREMDFLANQKAKLEKRNVELFSLSYIDSLTGTCNRRLFDDYLASNWRVSALSGKPLGMILIDIDEFKDYNEFYGHRQGDVCLTRICEIAREQMNDMGLDTLARYGGEEFAVIVSDISGNELFAMAEKLRMAIEAGAIEHRSSSTAPVVTISLGCAVVVPSMDTDPETLIDAADVALHQAKAEGRNRTGIKSTGVSWEPRLV